MVQLGELAILNIPPIEQELKGITQLILIPHRDLHRFPLHALFTNNFDLTIAYLPSTQIGINLQKRQLNTTNHLLSVKDPTSKGVVSLGFAQHYYRQNLLNGCQWNHNFAASASLCFQFNPAKLCF